MYKNILSLIIIGLCLGWMTGVSISPNTTVIITSIMGVMASILIALFGLDPTSILLLTSKSKELKKEKDGEKKVHSINLMPLSVFILFLTFGAIIGIFTRTHEWLGTNQIVYLAENKAKDKDPSQNITAGVLFAEVSTEECENFCTLDGNALLNEMKISENELIIQIANHPDFSDQQKEKITKIICKCSE